MNADRRRFCVTPIHSGANAYPRSSAHIGGCVRFSGNSPALSAAEGWWAVFRWDQVAWEVACRLLGGCLDIAKQPHGKSVGSSSGIKGCDNKTPRGTLVSNVFFFGAAAATRAGALRPSCGSAGRRPELMTDRPIINRIFRSR